MSKIQLPIERTSLETWFERDRAHVELLDAQTGKTIVEWWDEQVSEAVEDGFLSTKGFVMGRMINANYLHASAYDYAAERALLPLVEEEEEN